MTVCSACGALLASGDPSPAEARVLAFVLDFHFRRLRFPTYREIATGLGFRSVSGSWQQVHGLAGKGLVTIQKYRGIKAARGVEHV